MVLESVERILKILNKEIEPEPTAKLSKCKSCKLRIVCDVYKSRF